MCCEKIPPSVEIIEQPIEHLFEDVLEEEELFEDIYNFADSDYTLDIETDEETVIEQTPPPFRPPAPSPGTFGSFWSGFFRSSSPNDIMLSE